MFDCNKGIKIGCKGDCCGCVPIKKEIVKKYENKAKREVIQILEFKENEILPITKDFKCVFLNDKFKCEIYEDRPNICREFGLSKTNELLMCPYLKPSGNVRSNSSKKKLQRICNKKINHNLSKQRI